MKRLTQVGFMLPLLLLALLLSGCSTQGVLAVKSDKTLPKIKSVKLAVDKNSVGFEWPAITDKRVKGIKVYRAVPQQGDKQKYNKIATIDNPYATHYVDTDVLPNRSYLYTFTTYSILSESDLGTVVRVKTRPAYRAVDFVKTYLSDSAVVKILWRPHPSSAISGYIIERRVSGAKWKYLTRLKGRLSPEYIDRSVVAGHQYSYRIVARSSDGVRSLPSRPATLEVR